MLTEKMNAIFPLYHSRWSARRFGVLCDDEGKNGLKYITSMPGLQQRLQVAHIELSPQTKKELDERFVLIYTGQRRLARNLLRDVVGRYVG